MLPQGSRPRQSGGQNQKWPTFGQGGYVTPALSGMPPRGSPPLQSGGQTQKSPTSWQGGYATPAAPGIPAASERRVESEVAHMWARWLRNPSNLGDPCRFRAEGRIRSGPLVGKVASQPLPLGDPRRFRAEGRIRSGPHVGKVAT